MTATEAEIISKRTMKRVSNRAKKRFREVSEMNRFMCCPFCNGNPFETCKECFGSGFIKAADTTETSTSKNSPMRSRKKD